LSERTQTVEPAVDADKIARLRSVALLASVPERELACLADASEVRIEAGEIIARQGEAARDFWILLSGQVRYSSTLPDGREGHSGTIPAGAALGELSILAGIPNSSSLRATETSQLLRFDEEQFWSIMTSCPEVRRAILGHTAEIFQKLQSIAVQQEKMASLGALAAGLMHELNNPGAAAVRAAAQLRQNLLRMHSLTAKFSKASLSERQKQCMFELQEHVLAKGPVRMNSLEQSDAEEALAEWMENANVEDAWKLAPALVSIGIDSNELECAREEFGPFFGDAISWLEALVSSMQLVGTIEESIGRVSTLVKAVKSYAYEGKGQKQSLDIKESIYATLVILSHKLREKQIVLKKEFAPQMAPLQSECTGLNQIWTNILDNAIDAAQPGGEIRIRTWEEEVPPNPQSSKPRHYICISIADNGPGIPIESQAHIFDPFYTTKAPGVGTGLGLGIVQRIVEQYDGTITFSSEPGATEFRIRLPRERD